MNKRTKNNSGHHNNSNSGNNNRSNNRNKSSQAKHPPRGYKRKRVSGSDIPLAQNALKGNKRKNYHRNDRRYHDKKNKPISAMPLDKIFKRYDYLLELHIIARKKYFENHYKNDLKLVNKLEKSFYESLENLINFKKSLSGYQKEHFKQKYDYYPEDNSYSSNHNLEIKGEQPPRDYQINWAHETSIQKELSFSEDTEESTGTIEDYNKYKGISA